MVNQKKGWIKVVESFMAIILLLGIISLILNNVVETESEISVWEKNNINILSEIQIDESLRNEAISLSLPSNSEETGFSSSLIDFLEDKTILGTNCILVACSIEESCSLIPELNFEIYSSEVLLFTNQTEYSPRKLKIFCYKNEI